MRMRRVRSRILYEQMKGRATRRCDDIGKTVFRKDAGKTRMADEDRPMPEAPQFLRDADAVQRRAVARFRKQGDGLC